MRYSGHYVIQDAHYLLAYGRALAVAAAKAYEADDVIQFLKQQKLPLLWSVVCTLTFMQEFEISKAEFENTPLTLPAIIIHRS